MKIETIIFVLLQLIAILYILRIYFLSKDKESDFINITFYKYSINNNFKYKETLIQNKLRVNIKALIYGNEEPMLININKQLYYISKKQIYKIIKYEYFIKDGNEYLKPIEKVLIGNTNSYDFKI